LVYRGLTVPFILIITCFAAWGSAANLAAGLSILETSANPFVIAMGPEENATQRLNLAQSFNPVGTNIGVLLGALLILPQMTPESEKAWMTAEQLGLLRAVRPPHHPARGRLVSEGAAG
jgi:fucose permease